MKAGKSDKNKHYDEVFPRKAVFDQVFNNDETIELKKTKEHNRKHRKIKY